MDGRKKTSMEQDRIQSIADHMDAGDKTINGATLHPTLAVVNTAAAIEMDQDAMTTARDNYENAKTVLGDRRDEVVTLVNLSRETLTHGRNILRKYLGKRYNQNWDSTGLVGNLQIPIEPARVKTLLPSFKAHFTANPARENADLGVTALNFEDLHANLVAAENSVINQETAVKTMKDLRDAKVAAMGKRLSAVFGELKMKLTPLDPRWIAFGFKLPGVKERPPTPEKVSAVLIGNNAMSVKWEAAPRAEYYRVWKKVNGVDLGLVQVGTPADLDFTIEGLPANSIIEIGVSAVNNGGESAVSILITANTL